MIIYCKKIIHIYQLHLSLCLTKTVKFAFLLCFISLFFTVQIFAQEPVKPTEQATSIGEQQLENITENNEDVETEDDSYLLEMAQYQKNPINLNFASSQDLKVLRVASPIQIQNLIAYRNSLGKLVNIYELQAVPGWDVITIQKLRPYITVNAKADVLGSIGNRLRNGNYSILARVTQTLEKSRGYTTLPAAGKSYYPGSPQRLFIRYRYTYKNLLQYGIVAEKDQGEEFFKGNQKQGFDFYSAHFFARNIGVVKSLAIGDFTVNMGQGLTQWMSLAFKKGADVFQTKREADVLRPYNSAGEIAFHRGVGLTIAKKNVQATVFASYKRVDANFNAGDTLQTQDDFISSLQTSGLHRTASEYADKGVQRQLAFGGNVGIQKNNIHLGLNAIQYKLKFPLKKGNEPYNLYALSGSSFGNYSADYSYTCKNAHFFGEAAISSKKYAAFVNGLLLSVANNVDMSFVYRNISKGYQSLYSNAFTESTFPTNEKGLFSGIAIKPNNAFTINAYVDYYKFPWLKFRINAPTTGTDYLIQLTYRPNRQFEIYTRFKAETKSINYNPNDVTLNPVIPQPKQCWRTQFTYKITPEFSFRSRVELVFYDKKGLAKENGFLMYTDYIYKPLLSKFSGNVRLQYFETDGFNSRLYAYENDVLYSFSIPVFSGKGYRYYANINYDLTKKLTIWARIAQFYYPNNTNIGSGLDEIKGKSKTEVKLQALYNF